MSYNAYIIRQLRSLSLCVFEGDYIQRFACATDFATKFPVKAEFCHLPFFKVLGDVGVDVKGHGRSGMAEPLLDNLDVYAPFHEERGMGMAETVELAVYPEPCLHDVHPRRYAPRVHAPAFRVLADRIPFFGLQLKLQQVSLQLRRDDDFPFRRLALERDALQLFIYHLDLGLDPY